MQSKFNAFSMFISKEISSKSLYLELRIVQITKIDAERPTSSITEVTNKEIFQNPAGCMRGGSMYMRLMMKVPFQMINVLDSMGMTDYA